MGLWSPRPRGTLVREAPEWFNDSWYLSGAVVNVPAGNICNFGLFNPGTAPVLLLLYSLQITCNANAHIQFGFFQGIGGLAMASITTQAASQSSAAGEFWSGTPFASVLAAPQLFVPSGTIWFWPYDYPLATIEVGYSFRFQLDNQTAAAGNFSVTVGWIEGEQG